MTQPLITTPPPSGDTAPLAPQLVAAAWLTTAVAVGGIALLTGFLTIHFGLTWTPGPGEYTPDNPAYVTMWFTVILGTFAVLFTALGVWKRVAHS